MKNLLKHLFSILFILAIGVLVFFAFQTEPLKVETALVSRGPMQVVITAEGKTRVQDRFLVTAPVSGKLSRVKLRRGDQVLLNDIIAKITPTPSIPLDSRQLAEAKARLSKAEELKKEADTTIKRLTVNYEQAEREFNRSKTLVENGIISRQDFERLENNKQMCFQELTEAKYRAYAASSEVEMAKATLLKVSENNSTADTESVSVKSPIKGQVLQIIEENERVVSAGTPLIEISSQKLEIVIDVLSTDAVKIKCGATVIIEGWGGKSSLKAKVRLIEPSAFTKISALGVEEQRVNVIADLLEIPDSLGDGYRVEAKIVIWEKKNVLKLPISALFRKDDDWYVFVVENKLTKLCAVKIDHITDSEAEVISGLKQNQIVITHPSNQVIEGIVITTSADK